MSALQYVLPAVLSLFTCVRSIEIVTKKPPLPETCKFGCACDAEFGGTFPYAKNRKTTKLPPSDPRPQQNTSTTGEVQRYSTVVFNSTHIYHRTDPRCRQHPDSIMPSTATILLCAIAVLGVHTINLRRRKSRDNF